MIEIVTSWREYQKAFDTALDVYLKQYIHNKLELGMDFKEAVDAIDPTVLENLDETKKTLKLKIQEDYNKLKLTREAIDLELSEIRSFCNSCIQVRPDDWGRE